MPLPPGGAMGGVTQQLQDSLWMACSSGSSSGVASALRQITRQYHHSGQTEEKIAEALQRADVKSGSTALHYAASSGDLETVELVLAGGGDPDIPDKAGRLPITVAHEAGHAMVVKALQLSPRRVVRQAPTHPSPLRGRHSPSPTYALYSTVDGDRTVRRGVTPPPVRYSEHSTSSNSPPAQLYHDADQSPLLPPQSPPQHSPHSPSPLHTSSRGRSRSPQREKPPASQSPPRNPAAEVFFAVIRPGNLPRLLVKLPRDEPLGRLLAYPLIAEVPDLKEVVWGDVSLDLSKSPADMEMRSTPEVPIELTLCCRRPRPTPASPPTPTSPYPSAKLWFTVHREGHQPVNLQLAPQQPFQSLLSHLPPGTLLYNDKRIDPDATPFSYGMASSPTPIPLTLLQGGSPPSPQSPPTKDTVYFQVQRHDKPQQPILIKLPASRPLKQILAAPALTDYRDKLRGLLLLWGDTPLDLDLPPSSYNMPCGPANPVPLFFRPRPAAGPLSTHSVLKNKSVAFQ